MARFRTRTLRWKAVESEQVAGYKIYWAKGNKVTYDSESIYIEGLTEIVIPDALEGFEPEAGAFTFGITAIDKLGNESDLTTLKEPLKFSAPAPPESLWLEPLDAPPAPDALWVDPMDRRVAGDRRKESGDEEMLINDLAGNDSSAPYRAGSAHEDRNPPSVKFYDDVGFRKL